MRGTQPEFCFLMVGKWGYDASNVWRLCHEKIGFVVAVVVRFSRPWK
jgi:hypothetical protein